MILPMTYDSFLAKFVHTFVAEPFRQLADLTGWRKRIGKINPFEFLISLVFGQMSALRQTLTSQAQSLSETVSRQALDQRFTPQAVEFLQASFAHVMAHTLEWTPAHPKPRPCGPTSARSISWTPAALIVQQRCRTFFLPVAARARPPT